MIDIFGIKEKSEKRKKEKKLKKELKEFEKEWEQEEKEDQELRKEVDKETEEFPNDKFQIKEVWHAIKDKEIDEEAEKYLTEEEKKKLKEEELENKKFTIFWSGVAGAIGVVIIVIASLFQYRFMPELDKVTKPLLEEYYQNRYGSQTKIDHFEEICYSPIEKDKSKECPGVYMATTEDNKHIMTINNEVIGDDVGTSKLKEQVIEQIRLQAPSTELIYDQIDLSYKPYYDKYIKSLPNVKALPFDSIDNLIPTNNLTLSYQVIYQNNINKEEYRTLIQNYTDDSEIILIKNQNGLPVNMSVVTKEKIYDMDVTATIEKEKGVIYYELDKNINGVKSLNIKELNDNTIEAIDNSKQIKNSYKITIDQERRGRKNEEDKPVYYLLKFSEGLISEKNFKQASEYSRNNNTNKYSELEIDDYQNVTLITVGGDTYLIAQDDLMFGRSIAKQSWLCKQFSIC